MCSDFADSKTNNVTNTIRSGKFAGMIQVRDKYAQVARDNINEIAFKFADKFNEVHRKGFGRGEFAAGNGRDFFEGIG